MIDFKYTVFFDADPVLRAIDKATKAVLSKQGAFVRTSAKSSIRKRKKPAKPGQPPSSHVGTLKKLIFFSYDATTKSVVVGPTPFGKRDPTGASLLEYGGSTTTHRGKPAEYDAFPFMQPALAVNQNKFPELFNGAVK